MILPKYLPSTWPFLFNLYSTVFYSLYTVLCFALPNIAPIAFPAMSLVSPFQYIHLFLPSCTDTLFFSLNIAPSLALQLLTFLHCPLIALLSLTFLHCALFGPLFSDVSTLFRPSYTDPCFYLPILTPWFLTLHCPAVWPSLHWHLYIAPCLALPSVTSLHCHMFCPRFTDLYTFPCLALSLLTFLYWYPVSPALYCSLFCHPITDLSLLLPVWPSHHWPLYTAIPDFLSVSDIDTL